MTKDKIEKAVKSKGYEWFEKGDYNLNIVSVRTEGNKVTNKFDDYITLSFKENGEWKFYSWECTTDPGTKWVLKYENPNGVARLMEGQYRGSHTIRKHRGKYDALCQLKPLKVWRDKNKDMVYDENNIEEGIFGINIHHAGIDSISVDSWSAGCTVFKKLEDFNLFMKICMKAVKQYNYQNKFTYTLINKKDLK